ncbi:(2Fe-2S)-binding protein [Lachnospiraceae bacterium LCP25S3_G4]
MLVKFMLNGNIVQADVTEDMLLLDFVRQHNCYSVKRGCETANCGLCTVLVDGTPVLSCATLVARVNGKDVKTLEGLQEEAKEFGNYMANEGADQCGFCNPGFIINVIAMDNELDAPTMEEVREYLAGNLCRCTGYMGQLRAVEKFLNRGKENR